MNKSQKITTKHLKILIKVKKQITANTVSDMNKNKKNTAKRFKIWIKLKFFYGQGVEDMNKSQTFFTAKWLKI